MQIKIKLMRSTSRAPTYATDGSSGMDCYADGCEEVLVFPGHSMEVDLGFAVELPPGTEMQIRPRSGLAFKHRIMCHVGTIDSDYRGEVRALLFNLGNDVVKVCRGDRVCQAVLAPVLRAELEIVDQLDSTARGDRGFGSSGR